MSSIFNDYLYLFTYFKNLKIRKLKILYKNRAEVEKEKSIDMFANLANNLPTSVKQASFHNRFDDDYLQLKKFLENCHDGLEAINLNNTEELNKRLDLLLSYIERSNNSLKFLGIGRLNKIIRALNDEELKLLNQIKARAVKIVDFRVYGYDYSEGYHYDHLSVNF
jgi:hypothetical protein